ncbi:hypothetical protein Tco_0204360 [Tanacetum coccineum]
MMNDEIKHSAPYLTYLALSTNAKVKIPKVGKGRGKGLMGKKEDLDEAIKLVESISLTEAEEQEKERHMHETHTTLVIGREVNLEADKGVDDNQKKKKLKGVAIIPDALKITDKEKSGDEIAEEEKNRDEKAEEEKAKNKKAAEEEVVEEQAGNEQTRVIVPEPQ